MLSPNSIEITYVNSSYVIANNLQNTGTYSFISPDIVFDNPTQLDFKISATNSNSTIFDSLFSCYVKHRIYIGQNNLEVMTQEDVKQLQLTDLVDTIEGKYPVGAGGYKWVCYPTYFGLKNTFKDFSTDIDIEMDDPVIINITNSFNIEIEYYCHRTFYKLGAEIEIVVS